MGINDFSFVQNGDTWSLATCSSDCTIKLFPLGEAGLGDATNYNLSEDDTKDYPDKNDRQQLGLLTVADKDYILAHSLNSDLNSFNYKDGSTKT